MSFNNAKVLLYGQEKIGKTTLASELAEDALILATEPGVGGLSAYSVPVNSWEDFRKVGAELAAEPGRFSVVAIDTIDLLYNYCTDYVCQQRGVSHPSEGDYGIVWSGIRDEWRLRISKFASLPHGTWFISHAQQKEIKSRIGSIDKIVPTLNARGLEFIHGFSDVILYATSELTDEGEKRIVHTRPSEQYEAGSRIVLPDPLPLDAEAIRKAIEDATTTKTKTTPKKKEESK